MIFALFLGLSTMTNISSSLDVYFSINGFMMFVIGSTVGAIFALLVYMITLFSVPMFAGDIACGDTADCGLFTDCLAVLSALP